MQIDVYRLNLLEQLGDVQVWRVNGHRIRDEIDIEFTNGHHHLVRPYIPPQEIWLDREYPQGQEWRFWMFRQLTERALLLRGQDWDVAFHQARSMEKLLRQLRSPHRGPLYRKQLPYRFGNRTVYLINGCLVRDRYYVDFTLGGHHLRYPWIPSREIWLDDAVHPDEWDAVLAHEKAEIKRMLRGQDYYKAHDHANQVEIQQRLTHGVEEVP